MSKPRGTFLQYAATWLLLTLLAIVSVFPFVMLAITFVHHHRVN